MDFIGRLESTSTIPVDPSHGAAHLIKGIFDVAVDLLHLIIATEVSRCNSALRLLCLTELVCLVYSAGTTRTRINAPIHTSIPTVNTLVERGGSCRSRLSFLRSAAEAVDVALADKDVLICVL